MPADSPGDLSKLELLTGLTRDVNSAPDMETALRVVVERTRNVMAADVCTIYLTDHASQRHVIMATDGLAPNVVGQVQIGFGKGLIGMVAESATAVNLDDIPEELDKGFVQQAGAGRFHGFLGVPITHRGTTLGVLVLRQRSVRRFEDADAAFLTTLAAQLGGAIAYAKASGDFCALCGPDSPQGGRYDGLPGAPGVAVGTGVVVYSPADLRAVPDRQAADPAREERSFREAVAYVQEEVGRLRQDLDRTLSSMDRAVFDTYALILDSPQIVDATVERIHQGNWAPGALRQTIERHTRRFDEMQDPYLRERGADIRQLGNRILEHLQGTTGVTSDYPPNTILIGRQVSTIDLGLVPRERLRGIISAEGSALSHAAILARALGVPAVMGVVAPHLEQWDGREVVVNGHGGRVHLSPSASLREEVERLIDKERVLVEHLKSLHNLPSITTDGVEVALYTNAGLVADTPSMLASGSAGIGLFRSEVAFMAYGRFPSEQEQVKVYRQVLEAVAPLPVNLRTLDVGGDKPLPYLPIVEQNPALGWRGIRLTLDHPEIFLTQLRAALRADVGLGNLRLLLPMITGVADVEQALAFLDQAHRQLLSEGVACSRPPVGIMAEVPSAVYQAEELARRVDFLSVGTNDLTQYLLAIDRGNPQVSKRLDALHPAVLRALQQVVDACRRVGKPATVCGEMACDPGCALLLLGMGYDGLSINAAALPRVKWAIRSVSFPQMQALAAEALLLDQPEPIWRLVEQVLRDAGLARLVRQGEAEADGAGYETAVPATPRSTN
ncbi:MAG: phosphoenolpyruvate--protein phosphotransferase [Nitrospirota bacterium]|jgi:phosphotransferase system enzyme I (PtsP)